MHQLQSPPRSQQQAKPVADDVFTDEFLQQSIVTSDLYRQRSKLLNLDDEGQEERRAQFLEAWVAKMREQMQGYAAKSTGHQKLIDAYKKAGQADPHYMVFLDGFKTREIAAAIDPQFALVGAGAGL